MATQKVKLIISGRVQGVGYRFWTRRTAEKLNLQCKVRNLENNQVEAILQGSEKNINKMIELCKQGPRLARIENIEVIKLDE